MYEPDPFNPTIADAMSRQTPTLLTPGPITASEAVLAAMAFDYNPGDVELLDMTRHIRSYVPAVGNASGTHVCVPLQGSSSFGIEASLLACVPAGGKVLVVSNGFYGLRACEAVEGVGRTAVAFEVPDFGLPDMRRLADAIDADPAITHVFVCHVETGSGAQNPVAEIGAVAKARGKGLIVDAIAAYGAVPLDIAAVDAEAVIVSPNKCFEGVPGMALPIIRRDVLAASKGRYGSFVLDLHARHEQYEQSGHWKFTPPTHVVAAVHTALTIHGAEGGQPARLVKYQRNWRRLVDGMRQLGISTLIPDEIASPIIATFHRPCDAKFDWATFHAGVKARGFWLFNGKLTTIPTFRIGCMGDLNENDVGRLVEAIADTLDAMGVRERAPRLIAAA